MAVIFKRRRCYSWEKNLEVRNKSDMVGKRRKVRVSKLSTAM